MDFLTSNDFMALENVQSSINDTYYSIFTYGTGSCSSNCYGGCTGMCADVCIGCSGTCDDCAR